MSNNAITYQPILRKCREYLRVPVADARLVFTSILELTINESKINFT